MEGHALQLSCLALHPFWGAVPGESHSARLFLEKNNKNYKKTVMYKLS